MVRRKTYDIYIIECPYGVYVGSTELQLKQRWAVHRDKLKRRVHPCKGLQRAYDEGYALSPVPVETFRTQHKASCKMAERYYQLYYARTGELMNTRIEKYPVDSLCKYGKKFSKLINDLG